MWIKFGLNAPKGIFLNMSDDPASNQHDCCNYKSTYKGNTYKARLKPYFFNNQMKFKYSSQLI